MRLWRLPLHHELHDDAGLEGPGAELVGNKEHASCVSFSPCGERLLTGGEGGVLRLWELGDGYGTGGDDGAGGGLVIDGTEAADGDETEEVTKRRRKR